MIYRVGLTGGIGAGKSTVARRFAERGIPVIDADTVVHALYRPGGRGARAIAETFGPEFLDADGAVDRPKLAAHVFTTAGEVERLNAAIHPMVLEELVRWYEELEERGEPLGVVEATLLIEAGGRSRYDVIVTVAAPEAARVARVLARHPEAEEAAVRARIAAQMSDPARAHIADVVLVNEGDVGTLLAETDSLAGLLRDAAVRRAFRTK